MLSKTSHYSGPQGEQFPMTHWTLLLEAARVSEDTRHREALTRFCELYWGPLYNFARRKGKSPQEAEDLTQGFFERILERNLIAVADQTKGSFRCFLLRSMTNFMINEWQKAQAGIRNPGSPVLSFDAAMAETRYLLEPVDHASPECIYERDCAWALVEKAIALLRSSYEKSKSLDLFEQLKPTLMGDDDALPYRELAQRLHTTQEALRSETCRMRKELRRLVIQLLAPVAEPSEIAAEINGLFQALRP